MDRARDVTLVAWRGPWRDDDADANFKAEVALYADADPLSTITALAEATGIPAGAICQFVLARWASAGSAALMEIGPEMVNQLTETCEEAESAGTDAARLAAYHRVRHVLSWLAAGDPPH